MTKPTSASHALLLASFFFLLPLSLAFLYPISFWLGNDYEPLGLANALNFAFRLGDLHMYPANGMTNHPGVPFYFMSWSALALSGYPVAYGSLEFFHAVLDQIRTYQLSAIALASLVGACSVYLFVRISSPLLSRPMVFLSLALWILSTRATITTFLSPSNESFALLVNVLFLYSLLKIARDDRGEVGTFAFAAVVGSIAYLNKLSYIYVPAALCAAMFAQYAFPPRDALRLSRNFLVFCLTSAALVIAVGYFVIGWRDFRTLVLFHRNVVLGSGLYGAGSPTVINPADILNAFNMIWSDKAFAIPLALLGGAALVLVGGTILLKRGHARSDLTIAVGCGTAAALSALFVLKHYGFNYSAGVSATLPGCVLAYHLLAKKRLRWAAPLVATLAVLLMGGTVAVRLQHDLSTRAESSRAAALDHEDILKPTAGQKQIVDFAYRVPFREYGEGFILTYAGVEPLTKAYVNSRRGTTNSFVESLVDEDVGTYVIDKNYFRTADEVKAADNIDLLGPKPVRYQDGDTLIELRTVFVLLRRATQ